MTCSEGSEPRAARTAPPGRRSRTPARSGERAQKQAKSACRSSIQSSEISQVLRHLSRPADQSAPTAPQVHNTTPSGPSSASKAVGCVCGGLAAPKACSRGARRQEKGIEGGGESAHRSLSPSANRPAQLVGATHPPQNRRPHTHCPPTRRGVPRGVAAPSPAFFVSKSTVPRLTQLQPGYCALVGTDTSGPHTSLLSGSVRTSRSRSRRAVSVPKCDRIL